MKKNIFFLLLWFIQCSSGQPLETQHRNAMDSLINRYKGSSDLIIAVLPFREKTEKQTAQEQRLYSMTFDAIFGSNKFRIVERELLSKLLNEAALAQKGLTDSEAMKVGKLAGADVILLSVREGKQINFRIVNVLNGEVLGYSVMDAGDAMAEDDKPISKLTNQYNCKLKLYEGADIVPDMSKRVYTTTFLQKNTRYIYADANCAIVEGVANENVNLFFKYFDNENSLINQNKHPLAIDINWGNFGYTSGWGYAKKATWGVGEYKIQFFINDEKLDEKAFSVK